VIWRLFASGGTGVWQQVPGPTTLAGATQHIIEAENIPVRKIVADLTLDADAGSDDAALTQIEFKGIRACYVIRRIPE
jgi:hypothetical protein